MSTKFCQGISDISDSYAGFIIDQWGVLHDGSEGATAQSSMDLISRLLMMSMMLISF